MNVLRIIAALAVIGSAISASPASAQFYFAVPDIRGAPVRGDEPGIGQPLPGATPQELQASLVWNMRAALNVAALQCGFEPTLLSVPNYNVILYNHKDELKKSYDVLTKYFIRTAKSVKAGQVALDQFGTRTYSSFTTVHAQYGFCQTAGMIARDAVFTPRGSFYKLATDRMRELRNSLVPWGEQRFPGGIGLDARPLLPRFDAICWNKKDQWVEKKCGPYQLAIR
jgi:hypothetical protein